MDAGNSPQQKTSREKRLASRKAYHARHRDRLKRNQLRYRSRLREKAHDLLGRVCACCKKGEEELTPRKGRKYALEFDHIKPIYQGHRRNDRYTYTQVLREPHLFQVLCADCNGWKDVGPFCPCPWWDEKDPSWRSGRLVDPQMAA